MGDSREWHAAERPQTSRAATTPRTGFGSHAHPPHAHPHPHHQSHPHPLPSPLRPSRSAAQLRRHYNPHDAPPLPPGTHLEETLPPPSRPKELKGLKGLKAALEEAQFVAGGLVGRSAESTKHYTIIRHSHALVWYRGPGTSVSITILADEPVPANRTVWLQARGYSGNAGMSLEALAGSRDKWIDVTPASEAEASHLPGAEERGIQRDMRRFAREAASLSSSSSSSSSGRAGGGSGGRHVPRETHLVRIPASAGDGYFRLLLCGGDDPRKTLCGSPVFRVASTSADMSVVRGASLGTMPLELGLRVASTVVGTHVVRKYTGIAGAVVQSSAASRFAARIPLHWAGVRSESALVRDGEEMGNGGLWVRR
ncbi:hypothetical protein C2857_007004 [Epichloe festucae Fl1]|uniref:Uncharacterized protein n=1 Tax=Epichloe festucae (strain Fl1) TaxID=877507 RepID=A0A7S9KTT2_EPIFF|nr:hypothetical protein C2857_007004 [Epichloe festucae Fl1]